jgi:hypothetical protein
MAPDRTFRCCRSKWVKNEPFPLEEVTEILTELLVETNMTLRLAGMCTAFQAEMQDYIGFNVSMCTCEAWCLEILSNALLESVSPIMHNYEFYIFLVHCSARSTSPRCIRYPSPQSRQMPPSA